MEEKKVILCGKCAALMGEAFRIVKLTGADKKVVCAQCGKNRYGGEYIVNGKAGRK